MRKGVWTALIVIVLSALPLAAEDADRGPITWLAYSKLKPNTTEAAVAMALEEKALMDKLMADGTVLNWGLLTPINHNPDDPWNFVQLVTLPGWAEVDAWAGAVVAKMMSQSEKEKLAMQKRFAEIYVEGSHFDEIVRHAVISRGGTSPRYFYAAEFKAQDGQHEAMVEFFKKAVVPMLDPMVADETLISYGVYSPELHLDVDWSHRFWYGLPSLGSIDKMTRTFEAAESPAFDAWAGSVFDMGGHSDRVFMVLYLGK